MITQLATVKARLSILESDTIYDSLLTTAIKAISARFDKECHRSLGRTVGATFQFPADETELCVSCYPIEAVTSFELKFTEAEGWQQQPAPGYLVLKSSIISLRQPLGPATDLARITYTGGYVLPGTTPIGDQTPLPEDLEQAAVEQVAYWFQIRDRIGRRITWPSGGIYEQFIAQDLLQNVTATLAQYKRYSL